jgi:hypothetical protein
MEVSGKRYAPAALYPRERTTWIHWIGGWVGLRAGLDREAGGKILCPCRGYNLRTKSVLQIKYNTSPLQKKKKKKINRLMLSEEIISVSLRIIKIAIIQNICVIYC